MTVNGTSLSYCGYIGSSADEQGRGIAVDPCGKAYVAGLTWSDQSTSPVTGGPDLTYNGDQGISGSGDAFVAKVAAALDD
jgi:hypothetical protein